MKTYLPLLFIVALSTSAWSQYAGEYAMKEGKFGIAVKAGPAFPVGEFKDEFKVGYTGFIEVPYNLSESLHAYAGVGYSHFAVDNAKLSSKLQQQEAGTVSTSVTAPYSVIPIVVGLNISYRYESFSPYFTMSAGLYFQRLESSGSFVIDGVTTVVEPKTQTWSQGAFAVGLGTLIPIGNKGWAIDLNAKFNSVVDYDSRVLITPPTGDNVTTRAIRYVGVLAGLSYTFQ